MLAAGIEHGAFHRLRHSCGTQLRRRGASLEEVQLHLGHEDLSFTRKVYVHLDVSDGPDSELLDDLAGCEPQPGLASFEGGQLGGFRNPTTNRSLSKDGRNVWGLARTCKVLPDGDRHC